MGISAGKGQVVQVRNKLFMKEETGTSILFILNGSLAILTPIRLKHPGRVFLFFSFPWNYSGASPRLRVTSDPFRASAFALDVYPLPSYNLIVEYYVVLGLTEGITRVALKMRHQKCRRVFYTIILLKKIQISAELLDDRFRYQV